MIRAAIVGLGTWGQNLVRSVPEAVEADVDRAEDSAMDGLNGSGLPLARRFYCACFGLWRSNLVMASLRIDRIRSMPCASSAEASR